MPNHVTNELVITGQKRRVGCFLKRAKGKNGILDFNKFIPYPQKFLDMDKQYAKKQAQLKAALKKAKTEQEKELLYKKYSVFNDGYNSGGYEWSIANWSTKWNAYDFGGPSGHALRKGEYTSTISFCTAWSPPIKVIIKMALLFPELTFHNYYEDECGNFKGQFAIKDKHVFIDVTE